MMKLRNLMLCLLVISSCAKYSQTEENHIEGDCLVTLNVSNLAVKSLLNGKTVLWQSGDRMSVYDGKGNCQFSTTQDGNTASFSGNAVEAESYFALYPYNASATCFDNVWRTTFPSEQYIVTGSFARDANVSVGRTEKSVGGHVATMRNIGCYLKFNVENVASAITSVEISSINGESLAGEINISIDSSGLPVSSAVDNVSSVSAINGGDVFPAGTYYLTMLPTELSAGIRVSIHMADGTTRGYTLPGLKKTERNNVYTLNPAVDYDIAGVTHEGLSPVEVLWDEVKPHVKLSVNKNDGKFAKNEKIIFKGCLDIDDNMPLAMSVYEEGLLVSTEDIELNSTEKVLFECSSSKAKSFIIYVHPRGGNYKSLYIGAVVAPEEYAPGFNMPADFVSYWDEQKAALRASIPEVTLTPCEVDEADRAKIEGWHLEISMPEGNPVRGYMAKPKNAADGTLPIFLYFHGAGVNQPAHLSKAVEYAKKGNKGVIALDMNAHGILNDQPESYYKELDKGELNKYWLRSLTTRQEYYFRLMCLRIVRALDYLCTLPEWDGTRVMSFGSSQGGYQAAAIAGLDTRVKYAILDVPAHTDIGSPLVSRKAAWPGIYDLAIVETPERINGILPYFDGANFLRNTTAKIICEAGLVDMTCPPGCVFAGFNVCASTDKTIYCYPYRSHTAADMPDDKNLEWKQIINWKKSNAINNYLK